ncbi:MAG: phage tail protein [Saprospiraceae bacterium]|nr:phage tail protein [Saprospiraceae bacterium]
MDPFVAEIRIFGFNFAPKGWAFCNGKLMAISQNTALFSLLGTTYGGDGRSTFALPDLQGRSPMFWGQGPGLTDRVIGESAGEESITLLQSEIPAHSHALNGVNDTGNQSSPGGAFPARANLYKANPGGNPLVQMNLAAVTPAGSSQPHNNMQPYLTLNMCIALQGIFPPRG